LLYRRSSASRHASSFVRKTAVAAVLKNISKSIKYGQTQEFTQLKIIPSRRSSILVKYCINDPCMSRKKYKNVGGKKILEDSREKSANSHSVKSA
jgi:hypothetical protein